MVGALRQIESIRLRLQDQYGADPDNAWSIHIEGAAGEMAAAKASAATGPCRSTPSKTAATSANYKSAPGQGTTTNSSSGQAIETPTPSSSSPAVPHNSASTAISPADRLNAAAGYTATADAHRRTSYPSRHSARWSCQRAGPRTQRQVPHLPSDKHLKEPAASAAGPSPTRINITPQKAKKR